MCIKCNYCGNDAALVSGKEIYPHRPDLYGLQFWSCSPCNAWVGCHKRSNAVPLGRLANAELRKAKSAAHAAFDPIWKSGLKSRRGAYEWLSKRLSIPFKDCHIGMFDVDTCERVVTACAEFKC
ncbi:zinc-finger-containing protein [Pantoea agglomerans]|uniref:zinc-finger-containing protein n=1 Tax=Enterobacter agglomerans TaxID=549 RepID=UPI0010C1D549|nr:zinc-finger-containing protein [Pantoea agglomerans]TKK33236.1 hypothetical protein PagCFBP13532_14545 [Pantoea agglomerans]